jgi:peptide/nickel transport system ATP-binding protein
VVEALLSVRELEVGYVTERGVLSAVDRVSFDLMPGRVLGLAGESGSGKSTIAQAILRTLRAPGLITGGQVLFEGQDVLDMNPTQLRAFRWRAISMVFQSAMNSLNPVLKIEEQLCDVMRAHLELTREQARERAVELLKLVGLEASLLNRYPHQLSGGMRQRVGIAIALTLKPQLLILDEPTTALDVVVQREILQQVAELQKQLGFAVLFITHDLEVLFSFCDDLAILYAGRIVEQAPAVNLRRTPQHPYTQGLLESFPTLDGPRRKLSGIAGSPPALGAWANGCAFSPRCPRRDERCTATPALSQIDAEQRVACHHPGVSP